MKPSITITYVENDNNHNDKIMISGAENHEEAHNAAKEWCEEHNCLLHDFFEETPHSAVHAAPQVYYATLGADDYN